MTALTLGTRGSLLALTQSKWVAAELEAGSGVKPEIEVIRTVGDVRLDQPLHEISGQGLFTRELDEALLDGRIQLAVHSLKDLPTELPGGLCIAATPSRVDPRDVLVGPEGTHTTLASLKKNAVVGTSSLRRVALLRAFRSDVTARTIRGNVDTRLRKLDEGQFDAIILAGAGLTRLGLQGRVTQWLERTSWLPAPGQGALAIVTRTDDDDTRRLLDDLNDPASAASVSAERTFLEELGGGCQVPIGSLGVPYDQRLRLWGLVASTDGKRVVRGDLTGDLNNARGLGESLAELLRERGAERILAELDDSGGADESTEPGNTVGSDGSVKSDGSTEPGSSGR